MDEKQKRSVALCIINGGRISHLEFFAINYLQQAENFRPGQSINSPTSYADEGQLIIHKSVNFLSPKMKHYWDSILFSANKNYSSLFELHNF